MLTAASERLPRTVSDSPPAGTSPADFTLVCSGLTDRWRERLEQAAWRAKVRVLNPDPGDDTLAQLPPTKPGVLVLPFEPDNARALDLQRQLQRQLSAACVVYVRSETTAEVPVRGPQLTEIFRLGAVELLDEQATNAEIDRCLIESFVCSERRRSLLAKIRVARKAIQTLTERQRSVLDLVMEGCTNKVIARRLEISPKTVEKHRHRITAQTQCRNLPHLAQLTIIARYPLEVVYSLQPSAMELEQD